MTGPVVGDDGLARCPWGDAPQDYRSYHDTEWGRAVRGDSAIFERLCLEAYQAGLSWLTILRRREAFRAAYADFDIEVVAAFDNSDIERLASDPALIRHRGKVEAVVGNARLLSQWRAEEGEGVLDALCGRARRRIPCRAAWRTCLRRQRSRYAWPSCCVGAAGASSVPHPRTPPCRRWVSSMITSRDVMSAGVRPGRRGNHPVGDNGAF